MNALDVSAHLGWPFTPGQYVKVKPGEGWRDDWQDVVLRVTSVRVRHSGNSGGFGGFEVMAHAESPNIGSTDFDANDLEPASAPSQVATVSDYEFSVGMECVQSSFVVTRDDSQIVTIEQGLTMKTLADYGITAQPVTMTMMPVEKPLSDADKAVHSAISRLRRHD